MVFHIRPQQLRNYSIAVFFSKFILNFLFSGTFTVQGDGIWQRNAYVFEGDSFDSCNGIFLEQKNFLMIKKLKYFEILGHPDQSSSYHNHIDPTCLYTKNSNAHSPIIAWLSDGYKIVFFRKLKLVL